MAVTTPPGAAAPASPALPGGAPYTGATQGAGPPAAPPSPPRTGQLAARVVHGAFAGTPGRLRLAGIATVLACLVFGLFAFVAASTRASALSDARAGAAQLVRVQAVRTNLVSADANLTNAFLVGGLEPPAARAAYERGIATASQTLATASGDNARDAAALAKVNDAVTRYTGLVESARANNRLGYPIGAAYLRQATDLLRADVLAPLESLGLAEQRRVDHAYSSSASAATWLAVGLVLSLIVLLVAQAWLAARVRRLLNMPLLVATAIVLVVGVVLAGVMAWSQSKAKDTRQNAYFRTVELASARIDAFDAKSYESLTLIARGQGQPNEDKFQDRAKNAAAILRDAANTGSDERATFEQFKAYQDVHAKIRADDDGGDWDAAVALATGNANDAFDRFAASSGAALDRHSAQLRHDLGSARSPLPPFAWIALVAGLAAAVAAGLGVSTRLREYR